MFGWKVDPIVLSRSHPNACALLWCSEASCSPSRTADWAEGGANWIHIIASQAVCSSCASSSKVPTAVSGDARPTPRTCGTRMEPACARVVSPAASASSIERPLAGAILTKRGPTLLSHRYERLMDPPWTLAEGAGWSTAPMVLPITAASVILTRRLRYRESSTPRQTGRFSRQRPKLRALSNYPATTGGQRGIRTLEGLLTLTPLAGVRLRPLGHLSVLRTCRRKRKLI